MKMLKKSIRLKTVRQFIAKTFAFVMPMVSILIILMLLAPFAWLKIILGYFWIVMLLTWSAISLSMYYIERKEVIEANSHFQKVNIETYREVTFGNENDVFFKMVIPATSAVSMWEFQKKYCFLELKLWDELYDYLYSMRETTEEGYCVIFKVKKDTVNFDSLKKYYILRDGIYYMV